MKFRIAHLLLIVAGLVAIAYPLTFGQAQLTCRDQVMRPGDVCAKADGEAVQTYEQRAAARRNAVPVIIGVGLTVTGFGVTLLVAESRRSRRASSPT